MQRVNLNLVPSGVPPVVYASQYDVGRQFMLDIYDGDDLYQIPDGAVVSICGDKPDHHMFSYSTEDAEKHISYEGSSVIVSTTEQMCAVSGNCICEISIKKDEILLVGTLNFFLKVEKVAVPDDSMTSASDLSTFQDMVDRTHASELAAANSAFEAEKTRQKTEDLKNEAQTLVDNFNKGALYSSDVIIPAVGWQGTEVPYTYEIPGLTDENTVLLDWATPQTTEEERDVICDAQLTGSKTNIIYAYGFKPDIDIPIRLVYLKGEGS